MKIASINVWLIYSPFIGGELYLRNYNPFICATIFEFYFGKFPDYKKGRAGGPSSYKCKLNVYDKPIGKRRSIILGMEHGNPFYIVGVSGEKRYGLYPELSKRIKKYLKSDGQIRVWLELKKA